MVRVDIAGRAQSGDGVFLATVGGVHGYQERSLRASGDAEEGTSRRRGQTGLWGYLGDENRGGGVNICAQTTRAGDASCAVVEAKDAACAHAVSGPSSRQSKAK